MPTSLTGGMFGGVTPGGTQASSSTYFPNPNILPPYVTQLLSALGGEAKGAAGQYGGYISNPTASPLYQNSLSGLLAALQPSEHLAQTNLSDQFRNAGNMASGAYGIAGANLQSDLLRNRQTLASQLLSQQFPQMVQALMAPQTQLTSLINGLKLSQGYGAPQVGGFAGGFGGASDPNDPFANMTHGIDNPYPDNARPGMTGVNAPPQTPGAPPTDPFAELERLLGSGSSGGGNIIQNGPNSWMTDNLLTSNQAFDPFTSTDYGYLNPQ